MSRSIDMELSSCGFSVNDTQPRKMNGLKHKSGSSSFRWARGISTGRNLIKPMPLARAPDAVDVG